MTRAVRSSHALAAQQAQAANVGDPYVSNGFDSSALDPNTSIFGNNVQIRMRIPKGAHGAYINSVFPDNMLADEMEFLLPANSSWVVTGKQTLPSGKLELTVDLIDQRTLDGTVVWP
jgi:hypothetical protein